MDTIETENGEVRSMVGRDAMEVFRLATLLSGLRLEDKGIRLSRNVNCRKIAKQMTGLRTNDRAVLAERVALMLEQAKSKVAYVERTE